MALTAVRFHGEQATGSPEWWIDRLLPRLAAQAEAADDLDDYYRGENELPPMCPQVRDAYRRLMAMARTNFSELIVEAVRERMSIMGFRTGGSDDPTGDAAAWELWQDNALDADADHVHRAKLAMGVAYVIVGLDAEGVTITPEDPRQVYAECDPVRRRRITAAIKVYRDDLEDVDRLFLYLPGKVYYADRLAPMEGAVVETSLSFDSSGWEWRGAGLLPTDVVPVVPFRNRPDLYGQPQGEFQAHLGHLDRLQYVILQRLEIATLQAFRQRALKGAPDTDEVGNPIDYDDLFAADPGAMWLLPETAELWESGQVDMTGSLMAAKDDIEQLAAVTRTPMHYFAPASANQSAEGATLARESLIFKIRDQLRQTGESWETVMALAFEFAGDPERASRRDMEVIWSNPERYSLAEATDAASKVTDVLPWRSIMEDIFQKTPQEIERLEAQRLTDAMVKGVLYQAENPEGLYEIPGLPAPPPEEPPEGEEPTEPEETT
jgi:hypothetical protein